MPRIENHYNTLIFYDDTIGNGPYEADMLYKFVNMLHASNNYLNAI